MGAFGRLTRDGSSRWAWAILTVVCLGLGLMAIQLERSAVQRELAAAQARAAFYANTVLFESLPATGDRAPITGAAYRNLITDVQGRILTDHLVARVRLWAPDGTLLFSTDERDKLGTTRDSEDDIVGATVSGVVVSRVATAPFARSTTSKKPQLTTMYETFTPQRVPDRVAPVGATQVDQYYEPIVLAAADPWRTVQFAMFGLGACCLLMLVLSLRRPKPRAVGLADADGAARRDAVAVRAELKTARTQLGELQAELEVKRTEVSALGGRLSEAERARDEAARAASGLRDELTAVSSERTDLSRLLEAAQAGAADVATARALEVRVHELEKESAGLTAVVRELRSEVQAREDEVATARSELAAAHAELEVAISAEDAAASTAEAQVRLDEAVSMLRQSESRAAAAESRAHELETYAAGLESRAAELESRAAELESRAELEFRPVELDPATPQTDADRVRLEERASLAELRAVDLDAELQAVRREAAEAEAAAARSAPALEAQALQLLEQRLAAAEVRAEEAERRLAGLNGDGRDPTGSHRVGGDRVGEAGELDRPDEESDPPPSITPRAVEPDDDEPLPLAIGDEASDLRARLARTAARKKRSAD